MEDRTWIAAYLRIAGGCPSPELIQDAANELERLHTLLGHIKAKCKHLESEVARLERLSNG